MEFLTPSYQTLLQIRQRMTSGNSVHEAIRLSLPRPRDTFHRAFLRWWAVRERGGRVDLYQEFRPPLQRVFIQTLERGLGGEPILDRLSEIEDEMRLTMHDQIERHLQKMPVILLLPLTGLIFPAFLLQLLGPLLNELVGSLK